jgi:hypothetical protein
MSRFSITREQADALYRLLDNQERTNEELQKRFDALDEELVIIKRRLYEVEQCAYELSNRQ